MESEMKKRYVHCSFVMMFVCTGALAEALGAALDGHLHVRCNYRSYSEYGLGYQAATRIQVENGTPPEN